MSIELARSFPALIQTLPTSTFFPTALNFLSVQVAMVFDMVLSSNSRSAETPGTKRLTRFAWLCERAYRPLNLEKSLNDDNLSPSQLFHIPGLQRRSREATTRPGMWC